MNIKDLYGFQVKEGDSLIVGETEKIYEAVEVNHYNGYEVDVTVVEIDEDENRLGEEFEADENFFHKVSEIIR
ncbi:hypothetical protein [Chengkuizengella sediminis]|uniref:hypothetical protein n=1 Tax=Chengkuizengella sediminis TaxID=1885917 RepID=UPI0013899A47|nr:hypothetical protein [Chengkuizengella sediminis]NDI35648.1 hypothetical protein [Chengkuizengella sediminis]